ncbi:MAG: OPT/YSL family transporter, partial [Planctomycetes bacterium]|nr:OPT/YSL family transporter [Planctomycetota bacterium]
AQVQGSWRWRVFSIGGAMGMGFGILFYGLPTLSGAIFGSSFTIFPIPFADWSDYTKSYLPAVATGLSFDLGNIILGMVMPYFAMVGSFIGLLSTFIMNPILYKLHILTSWTPGDKTVEIMFKNYIDLYFSFGIGLSLAIAVIGFMAVFKLKKKRQQDRDANPLGSDVPAGRGDIPNRFVVWTYLVSTVIYILVSGYLINWHPGVMIVLVFFGFLYTPIISYVTARLEGIAGQVVEIPYIRELSFILSGYQGVGIWFIPTPMANYGAQTVFYRQAELTGTRFTSLWKSEVYLFPVMIIATIAFASFIWGLGEIPSSIYPFTQQMWELNAKNAILVMSSTTGEYSQFQEALSGTKVGVGFGVGMGVFGLLAAFNAPTTLLYGLIRGIGQTTPHMVIPQFLGALLGRYYFERRLGLRWREYVPVLSAGFFCGAGLITMFCIGVVFLMKSSNHLPY